MLLWGFILLFWGVLVVLGVYIFGGWFGVFVALGIFNWCLGFYWVFSRPFLLLLWVFIVVVVLLVLVGVFVAVLRGFFLFAFF